MLQQKIVNEKMFRCCEMTISQLGFFSGVSDSKLSGRLKGQRALSNEHYLIVLDTLNQVQSLVDLLTPIPLDLRACGAVKELLRKQKDGELDYLKRLKTLTDDPQNVLAIETFKTLKPHI